MSRGFCNGLRDQGSILGRVIPKAQKWYLMPLCLALSIIRCGLRVKRSNPGNGVEPSPTIPCCSYWKGSPRVDLGYDRQLYFFYNCMETIAIPVRKQISSNLFWWVMVKAMDYGIVVSEFVLQSRYYVHFRTNTLGKGMNPLILPAMG